MPKNIAKTIHEAPNFCDCGGSWHLQHLGFLMSHLKLVNSILGYARPFKVKYFAANLKVNV